MQIKSQVTKNEDPARNVLEEITFKRQEFFTHAENCPQYDEIPGKRQFLSDTIREIMRNRNGRMPIIAEMKFASPSAGILRNQRDLDQLLTQMQAGGACGISILTEPLYFQGSFDNLRYAATRTSLPLLMKDFLVDRYQVRTGRACGASNILVIAAICDLATYIPLITTTSLEPLIEIHAEHEIPQLERFHPKLVGVNNRNLQNLKIDFEISRRLIPKVRDLLGDDVIILSESGVKSRQDVDLLHSYGADGCLVGSSLMEAENLCAKLQELVG